MAGLNAHLTRRRIENLIGRTLSDAEYAALEDARYISEIELAESSADIEEVLAWARAHLAKRHRRQRPGVSAEGLGARANVEAELFAERGRADKEVAHLRRLLYGGESPPIAADAVRLLESPAVSALPATLIEHLAEVPARDVAAHSEAREGAGWAWSTERTSGWIAEREPKVSVAYLDYTGHELMIPASADSLMAQLGVVATRLSSRTPWTVAAAAAFVVEDVVPEVTPLAADVHQVLTLGAGGLPPFARITLTIEPWVSAEMVAEFYREVRSRLVVTTRGRPRSESAAELVQFVEAARAASPVPTWRELADAWTAAHPERPARDWRHFRHSYARGREALRDAVLKPGYVLYSGEREIDV